MFQRSVPRATLYNTSSRFQPAKGETVDNWRTDPSWGMEETIRYYNGLGKPVVLYRADGAHWVIEPQKEYTGEFRIECRILSRSNIVDFKPSPDLGNDCESSVKENARRRALAQTAGKRGQHYQWYWSHSVTRENIRHLGAVYIADLDACISYSDHFSDAPAHPSTVESRIGDNIVRGDGCGVFMVNNAKQLPPLYTNFDGKVTQIPEITVYDVEDGVYRYYTVGGVTSFRYVTPEDYTALSERWQFPIYRTPDEASNDAAITRTEEKERNHEEALASLQREHELALSKLEQKILKLENDTTIAKKESETRQLETKEVYAERGYQRADSLDTLKTVAGLATVAFGLYKLFA